jgi:hypothetical protein
MKPHKIRAICGMRRFIVLIMKLNYLKDILVNYVLKFYLQQGVGI